MSNIPKFNDTPPIVPDRSTGDPTFSQRMATWWTWLASFFTYLGTLVDALNSWVDAVPIAQVDDTSTASDKVWSASKIYSLTKSIANYDPTLLNDFTHVNGSYRTTVSLNGNIVSITLAVSHGSDGAVVFVLPAELRPKAAHVRVPLVTSDGSVSYMTVANNGDVAISHTAGWVIGAVSYSTR